MQLKMKRQSQSGNAANAAAVAAANDIGDYK